MIPENLEKLLTYNDYDFYVIEEMGFSNKRLAIKHELYETFYENDVQYSSTFEDIYRENLYDDHKISQIWIFKDDRPVGVCMGIHHDTKQSTYASQLKFNIDIAGYIQLFVKDEHRGQGLASQCIPLLESMLHDNNQEYPTAFIMQDKAYPFGKYLKNGCAISSHRCFGDFFSNRHQVEKYYQDLLKNENKLSKMLKQYSGFAQQYENYVANLTVLPLAKKFG